MIYTVKFLNILNKVILKNIKLKAAFVLFIFSLNMVVGTVCALGLDMGFNESHHEHEETELSMHIHANGQEHHHHKNTHKHKESDKKDNCCNDSVLKLIQTDKAIPNYTDLKSPVTTFPFFPVYYPINISYPSQLSTSNKFYIRGHHPPIPNILIAIQRFQI